MIAREKKKREQREEAVGKGSQRERGREVGFSIGVGSTVQRERVKGAVLN